LVEAEDDEILLCLCFKSFELEVLVQYWEKSLYNFSLVFSNFTSKQRGSIFS